MKLQEIVKFVTDNGLNLLLEGPHGTGKTQTVLSEWKKLGINFLYFNAPTIDIYDDIKGIPANVEGKLVYLKANQTKWEEVEGIFLDEPNRAHLKVINSLYELIQFRSLNGTKLPKLRTVVAAQNPASNEYTVESVDQSFLDRFHIYHCVEPCLSKEFFVGNGLVSEDVFPFVVEWWEAIPETIRTKHCSPRKVEQAINVFNLEGRVSMVLPLTCSPETLQEILEFKNGGEKNKVERHLSILSSVMTLVCSINQETREKLKNIVEVPPELIKGRILTIGAARKLVGNLIKFKILTKEEISNCKNLMEHPLIWECL